MCTGGVALPLWTEGQPKWFPGEFLWVVGCSYLGLPETLSPIRNPIGAAMSFRRSVFEEVGLFDIEMGRVAGVPLGCEETVLGIQVLQHCGEGAILHVPTAVVDHRVGAERTNLGYFLRRCFAEGLSKAAVARRVGRIDGSSTERRYATETLPRGVANGAVRFARGDSSGLLRSAVIIVGLLLTAAGYGIGSLGLSAFLSRSLANRSRRLRLGEQLE